MSDVTAMGYAIGVCKTLLQETLRSDTRFRYKEEDKNVFFRTSSASLGQFWVQLRPIRLSYLLQQDTSKERPREYSTNLVQRRGYPRIQGGARCTKGDMRLCYQVLTPCFSQPTT